MRDLADRLTDIRTAATDIQSFVASLDEAAFGALPETDRRTYRAIKNALAEIGEAIKQLPRRSSPPIGRLIGGASLACATSWRTSISASSCHGCGRR